MEWQQLFEPIASYLNFAIDLLMFRLPHDYVLKGSVDAKLLSYFLMGGIVLWLLGEPQKAGTPIAQHAESGTAFIFLHDRVGHQIIALYILAAIAGTAMFHALLHLSSLIIDLPFGNFKDTLNAWFAGGAVQGPLMAAILRFERFYTGDWSKDKPLVRKIGRYVHLGLAITILMYNIFVILMIHNLSIPQILLPAGAFLVIVFLLGNAIAQVNRMLSAVP